MARIIEFEGRHIEVPEDASDAEVSDIISAAPAAPAAPEKPGIVNRIKGAISGDKVAPGGLTSLITGAPKTAPPAGDSWTDTIMSGGRVLDQGVRGAAEGMVNIATLPVEGAALAQSLNPLARIHPALKDISPLPYLSGLAKLEPILGAEAVKGYLNKANRGIASVFGTEAPQEEPQTFGQRVAHRVGEEVGAAAVPVGGAIVKGTRIGVDAARQLPLLERMFVEPAAIDAGKFAAKEAGTAVAAGTGAAAINEATRAAGAEKGSWKQQLGDLLGALGGATTMGAARMIKQPTKDIFNALFRRDKFSNDQVKQEATDIIANASALPKTAKEPIDTQPLVDTIMGNPKVSDAIPGYVESLGDRTRDPGIASMEYSRQTGPNAGDFVQRRTENTQAVDQALDASRPTGTPGALRSELESERTRQLNTAGEQTATAQANLDAHLQRLQPAMNAEGRGANIRAALENASSQAREIVDAAWEPLNRSGQQVDLRPLADRYQGLSDNMSLAERERFRPREANIPERLAPQPEEPPVGGAGANDNGAPALQPIQEVTGLRSALTDAQREARTAGRDNEARIIGQHVEALDNYLDTAVPPDLRQQYNIAKSLRGDMADRFERPQTGIAQTLDRQQGRYRQPDSAVARKFVQDDEGNIANFRELMLETGNDERTVSAVRDQILADVRDRGLLNNPQQLDEYMRRYGTILSDPRFNNVRQELTTAGGLRGALDSTTIHQQNLTRTLGTPDTPGTGAVGQYLRYGDEKSTQAMKGVLASKEPGKAADELLNFAGNKPEAMQGARRTFWDLMEEKSRSGGETTRGMDGRQPWMPNRLKGFLDDPANRAVAERLYRDNPEHLANIERISDALQGVDLRSRAKAPNTSGTAQGVNNVLTPETIQSRFYAYKRGQTSLGFMVTALASVAARRAVRGAQSTAVDKLLDEALLNPDVAAELLKENNPANRAAMARTSKAFLGNETATVLDMLNGDDEDQTKAAAMKKGGK